MIRSPGPLSPIINWAGAATLLTKQGICPTALKSALSPVVVGDIPGRRARLQLAASLHKPCVAGLFVALQLSVVCACRLSASNSTASTHEVIIVFIYWACLRFLVICSVVLAAHYLARMPDIANYCRGHFVPKSGGNRANNGFPRGRRRLRQLNEQPHSTLRRKLRLQ